MKQNTKKSKLCNKCGVVKPLDEFSKNANSKDGRGSNCKACKRDYYHAKKNSEGVNTRRRTPADATEKPCTKCGVVKPMDDFGVAKEIKNGRKSWCKECSNDYSKTWREDNPEWFVTYNKENADKIREGARAHREANSERVKAGQREWRQKNKDKVNAKTQRRRAKKRCTVSNNWVKSECPDHLCYWCGIDLNTPGIKTHIDHIMPLSLYGPDEDFNKVPACSGCNVRKWATHPLVWIARMF